MARTLVPAPWMSTETPLLLNQIAPTTLAQEPPCDAITWRCPTHYNTVSVRVQSFLSMLCFLRTSSFSRRIFSFVVNDWGVVEKIWEHIFTEAFVINPKEHPVLLAEASYNTPELREKARSNFCDCFAVLSHFSLLSLLCAGNRDLVRALRGSCAISRQERCLISFCFWKVKRTRRGGWCWHHLRYSRARRLRFTKMCVSKLLGHDSSAANFSPFVNSNHEIYTRRKRNHSNRPENARRRRSQEHSAAMVLHTQIPWRGRVASYRQGFPTHYIKFPGFFCSWNGGGHQARLLQDRVEFQCHVCYFSAFVTICIGSDCFRAPFFFFFWAVLCAVTWRSVLMMDISCLTEQCCIWELIDSECQNFISDQKQSYVATSRNENCAKFDS